MRAWGLDMTTMSAWSMASSTWSRVGIRSPDGQVKPRPGKIDEHVGRRRQEDGHRAAGARAAMARSDSDGPRPATSSPGSTPSTSA